MTTEPIVEVAGLSRRFKQLDAVHDVSFAVQPGELFGFLGSNGRARRPRSTC